jgi:hypothetical protein
MKTEKEIKQRLNYYISKQKSGINPNQIGNNSEMFVDYAILDAHIRMIISELEWVIN